MVTTVDNEQEMLANVNQLLAPSCELIKTAINSQQQQNNSAVNKQDLIFQLHVLTTLITSLKSGQLISYSISNNASTPLPAWISWTVESFLYKFVLKNLSPILYSHLEK